MSMPTTINLEETVSREGDIFITQLTKRFQNLHSLGIVDRRIGRCHEPS